MYEKGVGTAEKIQTYVVSYGAGRTEKLKRGGERKWEEKSY